MPRPKQHKVELGDDDKHHLRRLIGQGEAKARVLARARVLLLASEGREDRDVASALHVCVATVENVRRRFASEGLEAALHDKPRPGARPRLDGRAEAHLVALACSEPPEGREHWTMRLLADRLVELELVESISDETVRRAMKKTSSSPGSNVSGASPR